MTATNDDASALWRGWAKAAAEPAIDAALRGLYDDLDTEVRGRGPVCFASGRCCNFEAYGHRLYVTGLEIAWVVKKSFEFRVSSFELKNGEGISVAENPEGCPFQIGKLCGVHTFRPLGCRVFFCQEGTQQWQQDLYERFLGKLRQMHEEHGLEYRYMEWRAALAEMARILGSRMVSNDEQDEEV